VLVLRLSAATRRSRSDHGLVGASDAVDRIRTAIEVAATHSDPVLLLGRSGTGKELVAEAIHRASARASKPFVAVNMATLAASTAAAELFGHSRGAFTGAEGAHGGAFGRADGGTLFLDEIGDTPPAVQPMLLRAIESGETAPVGGRGAQRVDVRIVAATDQDLDDATREFRRPLLHRLAVHTISLAPLSERREDVLPLFVRFLQAERPGADASVLPFELARELIERPWLGNVRELRNAARTLSRGGADALAPRARSEPPPDERPVSAKPAREITDDELARALARNGYRLSATARELGIARNTLNKRIEQTDALRRGVDLDPDEIRAAWQTHAGDLETTAATLRVSVRALVLRARELGIALVDAP
jgi:two-component system nitrogen regulation response regulator GlnG